MALSILIKTMEDINNINLPKIFALIKRNHLIRSAKSKAYKEHLSDIIIPSQIVDMTRFFTAAKQMNILKNDDTISDDSISTESMEINIVYCNGASAVIRVRMALYEVIYSITDSIKVAYIDNRDSDHSYRFTHVYEELVRKSEGWENNNKDIIQIKCFEILTIVFKLIIDLVFDNLQ